MTDRHKRRPRAVRIPDGLEAWLETFAAEHGEAVNAVIVRALSEFQARHEPAATTAAVPAPRGATARKSEPQCPHPPGRVLKGFCGACGRRVA